MGSAQSKIDNEESVLRCKERKNLMKEAVIARNAFAAGHSGYTMALKNTGAALSDYGHGEAEETHHQLDVTLEVTFGTNQWSLLPNLLHRLLRPSKTGLTVFLRRLRLSPASHRVLVRSSELTACLPFRRIHGGEVRE
ncbi:protein ALTERED PHOSPHATE STARVATION RESPONSE 1-like [Fagus crenata]